MIHIFEVTNFEVQNVQQAKCDNFFHFLFFPLSFSGETKKCHFVKLEKWRYNKKTETQDFISLYHSILNIKFT